MPKAKKARNFLYRGSVLSRKIKCWNTPTKMGGRQTTRIIRLTSGQRAEFAQKIAGLEHSFSPGSN